MNARPPMWKAKVGRPAVLQLGSVWKSLNMVASAPVRLATWVYSAVGRATPGFPVSRNVMHGCVALFRQVSAVRAAVSAVTWSMMTCHP